MTSSLPNLPSGSANPAKQSAICAELFPGLGAGTETAANPSEDFADLLPVAKPEANKPAIARQSSDVSTVAEVLGTTPTAINPEQMTTEIPREVIEGAAAMAVTVLQTLLPEVQAPVVALNGNQTASPRETTALRVSVGTDGAIEVKLALPGAKSQGEQSADENEAAAIATDDETESAAIKVDLQVAGELPVRFDAIVKRSEQHLSGREKFAAHTAHAAFPENTPGNIPERNFLFTGDKRLRPQSPVAGIDVAKPETIMPAALIEEPRTRNPELIPVLSARADFQVGVPPAERITVPVAAPAGQNFAERAVETVTNLVEAQFSASMQKSGSVHLQLKFGSEDLSVRVVVRDGVVHTDFRTDSTGLRNVLAQEWQSVSAQSPGQTLRYLEPVFSPGTPASSSADLQQHGFARQQSQQEHPSRNAREAWDETATFSRRSQLSESFIPEPAALRAPALLPTSLRLSALA